MRCPEVTPFRMTWRRDVPDEAIAWAMHLYHSLDQVEWCLARLRACYPASRVVLISDGDGEDYAQLARKYAADLVQGEHLHGLATCHDYVSRVLGALAAGGEPYGFKIDPDTAIWRRFHSLPGVSSVFGTLETVTEGRLAEVEGPPNVQGGCIGLTHDAVRGILECGVLSEAACVHNWRTTWARCDDMRRTAARGQFCDDYVISWAADSLGIPLVSHPEIRSRWRREIGTGPHAYAVTHPHKQARGRTE